MITDTLMLNLPYHVQRVVRRYPREIRACASDLSKAKDVSRGEAGLGWPEIQDCIGKCLKLEAVAANFGELELALLQYDRNETVSAEEWLDELKRADTFVPGRED